MRCQLVMLVVCLVYTATSSATGDCKYDVKCGRVTYDQVKGDLSLTYGEGCECISIHFELINSNLSTCNASITDLRCHKSATRKDMKTTTTEPECNCDTSTQCRSEPTTDGMIINHTEQSCISRTTVAVLGALVGLLLTVLAIVTTSMIWTCWLLKKSREMSRGSIQHEAKINAEYQLRRSMDHGQLVNPTYEGDDLLRLQPLAPVQAYETIQPPPRVDFMEQDENGYHMLSRELYGTPEPPTTHMETILEDSMEESYSRLGSITVESFSDTVARGQSDECDTTEYSKLETISTRLIEPNDTTDTSDGFLHESSDKSKDGMKLIAESNDMKEGQQEEVTEREPPLITVTFDTGNKRESPTS